MSYYETASKG